MQRITGLSLAFVPTIAAASVLALAIYAPIAQAIAGYPSGEWGYRLLFSICHQYPLRSFWLLDHPMAVCARCTGGYLGILLGMTTLLTPYDSLSGKRGRLLSLALCFLTVGGGDVILKLWTGVDTPNIWRLLAGLAGGLGLAFLIVWFVSAATCMVMGLKLSARRVR